MRPALWAFLIPSAPNPTFTGRTPRPFPIFSASWRVKSAVRIFSIAGRSASRAASAPIGAPLDISKARIAPCARPVFRYAPVRFVLFTGANSASTCRAMNFRSISGWNRSFTRGPTNSTWSRRGCPASWACRRCGKASIICPILPALSFTGPATRTSLWTVRRISFPTRLLKPPLSTGSWCRAISARQPLSSRCYPSPAPCSRSITSMILPPRTEPTGTLSAIPAI